MGGPLGQTGTQRQDRRGRVQGLDLGLFIHAEHHRVLGRVQVEPDDVADLGFQLRVGGELERLDPPGLQAPLLPHLADGEIADAQLAGQQPGRPVRHPEPLRWGLQGRGHHLGLIHRPRPTRLRPILQAPHALGGIAPLPADHRGLGHPDPGRDLVRPDPVTGQQHDPGPLRQPRPDRARPRPRQEHLTVPGRHFHLHSQRHHS